MSVYTEYIAGKHSTRIFRAIDQTKDHLSRAEHYIGLCILIVRDFKEVEDAGLTERAWTLFDKEDATVQEILDFLSSLDKYLYGIT